MQIKTSTATGVVPVTIMHIEGNIDSATYEAFAARADNLIENGTRNILMDLSETPFISSAGLRSLHGLVKKLDALHLDPNKKNNPGTQKSSHIKLFNLSEEIQTAFELSGFNMFIETYTDQEKAIASFQAQT